jgi:hypothetical protein
MDKFSSIIKDTPLTAVLYSSYLVRKGGGRGCPLSSVHTISVDYVVHGDSMNTGQFLGNNTCAVLLRIYCIVHQRVMS